MSLFSAQGGAHNEFSGAELREFLFQALQKLGAPRKVLAVPPDMTRMASRAGELTRYAYQ